MPIPLKRMIPSKVRRLAGDFKHHPTVAKVLARLSLIGSQAGQDYWVIYEAFNEKTEGYFVDLGAFDGLHMSNTYLLESGYKWRGLCIEANPETFKKLESNRRSSCLNVCVDHKTGSVNFRLEKGRSGILFDGQVTAYPTIEIKTCKLEAILASECAPSTIDYLSVDLEGAEDRVFRNFPFDRYIFRTMTIERPSEELKILLGSHGYHVHKQIPNFDVFFIHKSFIKEYKRNLFDFYSKKRLVAKWK